MNQNVWMSTQIKLTKLFKNIAVRSHYQFMYNINVSEKIQSHYLVLQSDQSSNKLSSQLSNHLPITQSRQSMYLLVENGKKTAFMKYEHSFESNINNIHVEFIEDNIKEIDSILFPVLQYYDNECERTTYTYFVDLNHNDINNDNGDNNNNNLKFEFVYDVDKTHKPNDKNEDIEGKEDTEDTEYVDCSEIGFYRIKLITNLDYYQSNVEKINKLICDLFVS